MSGQSPLWCANDEPHGPHSEPNGFGDRNHCTGRPGVFPRRVEREPHDAALNAQRALQDILDVWENPGPVPWYHDREKAHLKRAWPRLYTVIERAAEARRQV